LVYDPENRLILLSEAGKLVEEYGYAADGTRLWKRIDQSSTNVQVWIGNIYEEKGGKTLFHVYAGNQQVCTFEAGSYLDGGSDSSKVGYYYHEDNLNSSSALSDYQGNKIEVDSYFPFGSVETANPQASFQVSRRFTGQVFDSESGLYYYGSPGSYGRYYDLELGRFIQADTVIPDLGNPQSYNRYSYTENDPLTLTDPSGHSALDYIPWIGSGVAEISGNLALENMAQQAGYISYAQAAQSLGIGQATAGNVSMVAGVGKVTAGAANAYLTGGQEIATAGIATGVIVVRKGAQAAVRGAAEEAAGTTAERITIHHVATDKNLISTAAGGPYTQKFEALFEKGGMTLQDALNKVPVLGHRGPHPEYNQLVYDRLSQAVAGLKGDAYKSALQGELKAIGKESQTRGTVLNKLITR
jgi:RHS repeat-associated protein